MEDLAPQVLKILQIIWINIILSGDNAVVIALACRGLPKNRQRMGMVLGAGVAVVLRIIFTVGVVYLLATPFLKIAGGLLLFWIAVKLVVEDEEEQEGKIAETDRLWHAVRTIAIADAVMSLDNVLAIAAVAKDSLFLLILGLAISIPLCVAGEMLITDPWLEGQIGTALAHRLEMPMAALGALFVVGVGYLLKRRAHQAPASGSELGH